MELMDGLRRSYSESWISLDFLAFQGTIVSGRFLLLLSLLLSKAPKPTLVIIRCRSGGRVKLPHIFCCSGERVNLVSKTGNCGMIFIFDQEEAYRETEQNQTLWYESGGEIEEEQNTSQ
ncbi:hypothetical protein Bca101_018972 [Brassica carinata]